MNSQELIASIIDFTESIPPKILIAALINLFIAVYLGSFALSLKSIFNACPAFPPFLGWALLEIAIITVTYIIVFVALLFIMGLQALLEIRPDALFQNQFALGMTILSPILFTFLRRYIATMMLDDPITFLQAFSSQVMQLCYIYLIPVILFLIISVSLSL